MTLRVLLLQLPVPNNPATNIPLAAGYLKAYALAADDQSARFPIEIDMVPRALADHAGDARLVQAIIAHAPDVLGLSLYTWNSERSLAIAQRVKACLPDLIVVGGGPEVQPDNDWLIRHPGLTIGVIGEGEQTFCALLHRLAQTRHLVHLDDIAGLLYRTGDHLVVTAPRPPLSDLAVIPSPYLANYLELSPGGIALIEVSRWCPYSCSFCLYGRNAGVRLGQRFFGLERILAEVVWARAHGATSIHFVEANLNLLPCFRPLMAALAQVNADRALKLYAELRAEHLSAEVVAALDQAGLRVAEVGLQTANPAALGVCQRKTDLLRWADGTRRLLAHGIEVLLDVILGLPADDVAGVQETLRFINAEGLGSYDVFMLQVLPGTRLRQQAHLYGLIYQPHPPYYILSTDRMTFAMLRELRHELKRQAGLEPDAVDGWPVPHRTALRANSVPDAVAPTAPADASLISQVWLQAPYTLPVLQLASHVDLVVSSPDLPALMTVLGAAMTANPSTLFDLYLLYEIPPAPAVLQTWRDALPYHPGYLDALAVYQDEQPVMHRASPRLWLVLPWTSQTEPAAYTRLAGIIWRYELVGDTPPPLGAWRVAGGAGVWVPGATPSQASDWQAATGLQIWI